MEIGLRAVKAVAILGLLTAVASVVGQASAAGSVTTAVRCSLRAHLTAPLAQTGAIIGSVTCGHSIGKGRYNGRYRDNVAHWPTVSETGSSKLSFKSGSIRGTYTLGPALASGLAPYRGTFHITGGTGRLKHATGTLDMTCAHRIPALTRCTMSGSVAGVQRHPAGSAIDKDDR